MKIRFISPFRQSRLIRAVVSAVIGAQILIGTPVFAQEAARFGLYASGRFSSDVSAFAQVAARKITRLSNDAKRKVVKAGVRVNRTVPKVTPPPAELTFGVNVTTEMIRMARVFDEPLIPVGEPGVDENRELGRLLQTVATLARDRQAAGIDVYLTDHPASPWKASLLATAAVLYAKEGYYSRAASYWEQAFWLTRDSTEPGPRAIADYVLGESLTQMMNFGQTERMGALFAEIQKRDVRGTAGAKVSAAREGLTFLSEHHDMATFSGPMALRRYLLVRPTSTMESSLRAINEYHPPAGGTTLSELKKLAREAGVALEMVHLAPVGEIPVPSIVHLRSQHYTAIVGKSGDRYIVKDPAFGGAQTLSGDAIRDESSGYFLLPAQIANDLNARIVPEGEAVSVIGNCMPGGPAGNDPPCPNCGGSGGPGGRNGPGMPGYSFHPQKISLLIDDVPVGYTPPVGPPINFQLSYDHRENRLPQTFTFGNVGAMWSHNWMSSVTEGTMQVQMRGIGQEQYLGYVSHPFSGASLVKVSDDPIRYERTFPDGTIEVFTFGDRPASQPNRKVFLTEIIDPQGHSVTLTYDSSVRLVAITDAIGQVTTFDYQDAADPLRITKITDPFGRFASLSYDASGRLAAITDAVGMSSSFSYGGEDFIQSMTTPYGTTTFRHEPPFAGRRIEATDPAGGTERLEYYWSHGGLPTTLPSSEVPTGFTAQNVDMHKFNSLYWDKLAMAAGPTLSNATITSLVLGVTDSTGHAWARNIPHSIKRPLESRVWYVYGTADGRSGGSSVQPTKIGRVLEDGSSQITEMTYNSKRMITSRRDPAGRQTNYTYATNGLDLLTVEQVRSGGTDVIQAFSNYSNRLPGTITDAAGQDTDFTYNSEGQPLTVTNAKNETTTYTYEPGTNNLLTVTGPVTGATTTYAYDAYGRVESVEDADGYVVISDYDNLNRLIQRTYPDDTTETLTYTKLSLSEQKDRLGRITRHFDDGFGRRIATRDPAGRTISQVWCDCGAMDSLVDANGNRTRWERDVQGRVTREIRADNTTDTLYTYDLLGRLKTLTDPKDQVTTHSYNIDDSLSGTAYTNEEIETPNVSYTYDQHYARVATMVDGIGTTTYTYKAVGTNGAGQVATIDGPLSNDTIGYTYDELGRVVQRTINGSANQVDWTFDALGRVTSEENLLGEFAYTYDGVTNRLATVTYPNGQTSTYTYLNTENDHRVQTIHHKYPNTSTLSKFDYTYDTAGNILTWRQQSDTTAVMWKYGYDRADQLISAVTHATDAQETVLKRYAYAYDPAGNRTVQQIDDAVTLSAYDNLNRLTSQAPGGPMVIAGSLNEPGTVTISGVPVTVDASNNFRGTVPTTTGTNTFTVVAKDASGNTTTQQYEVDVTGAGTTFTYDSNSNLTGDGDRTWTWNAANRLVTMSTAASVASWTYDGGGFRASESVEQASGTSPRTLLWCEGLLCRTEDATTVQHLFSAGWKAADEEHFLAADHLGSVTDVLSSTATLESRYAYDPFGRPTTLIGSVSSPWGFARLPQIANLGLAAQYREYFADFGRWISQDPALTRILTQPQADFRNGNGFVYSANNPLRFVDPTGLQAVAISGFIRCISPPIAAVLALAGALADQCKDGDCFNERREADKRDRECYAKYIEDTAFCGARYTVDYTYNKCMAWAWTQLLRCRNGVHRQPFNP